MPSLGKRSLVTISPRDYRLRMKKLIQKEYPKLYDRFVDELSQEGVRIMKKNVPVRSGMLKNSIRVGKKEKKGGGADRRANIEIGPTVAYGIYVDQGTKSSSGRFVPQLGRRVRTGTHPGISPRNYIARTAEEMEPKIKDFYTRHELLPFKMKWGQEIKGKKK